MPEDLISCNCFFPFSSFKWRLLLFSIRYQYVSVYEKTTKNEKKKRKKKSTTLIEQSCSDAWYTQQQDKYSFTALIASLPPSLNLYDWIYRAYLLNVWSVCWMHGAYVEHTIKVWLDTPNTRSIRAKHTHYSRSKIKKIFHTNLHKFTNKSLVQIIRYFKNLL